MAASDRNPPSDRPPAGPIPCLAADALSERLAEEVNRAGRHGTPLSCLLVTIGNLEELAREHGRELSEQTLAYVANVLVGQVRGFDRVGRPSDSELLLVLPGADGPRGEIVARRVIERLRTIKVGGPRRLAGRHRRRRAAGARANRRAPRQRRRGTVRAGQFLATRSWPAARTCII
jgi:GGDEF domain-containing protein